MVTIKYGNSFSQIVGVISPHVIDAISDALSYVVPNYHMTDAYRWRRWDGRKRLYHRSRQTFPTGLMYLVEEILETNSIEYRITGRKWLDIYGEIDLETTTLRPYQIRAVADAVEAGRGLINLPTGSGKSWVAVGILSLIGRKAIVTVHVRELLFQMVEHCEQAGLRVAKLMGSPTVERHYKNGWEGVDVYIATSQTLHSVKSRKPEIFKSLTEQIEVFIIDEVQRSGADTYFQTMLDFKKTPYRYG